MLRRACEELADGVGKQDGNSPQQAPVKFIPLEKIKAQIEMFNHGHPVEEKEILDICETEGNEVNGGGSFDVRDDDKGGKLIRFVSGDEQRTPQPVQRAVGYHPGSPIGTGAGSVVGAR
jgi:hypothetical protein